MCSYQVAFRLYTIVVEKNQNCSNIYLRMKGLLNSVGSLRCKSSTSHPPGFVYRFGSINQLVEGNARISPSVQFEVDF